LLEQAVHVLLCGCVVVHGFEESDETDGKEPGQHSIEDEIEDQDQSYVTL